MRRYSLLILLVLFLAQPAAYAQTEPKTAEEYTRRAFGRRRNSDLAGAIADLTKAIELTPTDSSTYFARAEVRRSARNLDEAIADYTSAIQLDPKALDSYLGRAEVLQLKADFDGAIADYTKLIDLDPQKPSTYSRRAAVRERKQDYDGAIADYTKALELDPGNTLEYRNRADARERKGDLDGAIADHTKIMELEPKDTYSYRRRASLRKRKGDYDGAVADYSAAVRVDPQDYNAYYSRGDLRKSRGDSIAAAADYSRGNAIKFQDAFSYSLRGFVREDRGDLDGAVEDYTKSIELDPANATRDGASAYRYRAAVKLAQGKLAEARRDVDAGSKLDRGMEPLSGKPVTDVKRPSALPLRVDITRDARLLLNGERRDPKTGALYGSVKAPGALRAKLTKVLQERDAHPGPGGSKPWPDLVEKTVFIKAPESMKYGDVVRVIDAVKAAGADPVGLQVDGLEPKANVPEEKERVEVPEETSEFSATEWRLGIRIPKETAPQREDRAISSKDSIVISIVVDGEFYLGAVKYEIDIKSKNDPERKRLMRDLKAKVEQRSDDARVVYIKSHNDVSYGQVVRLIDVIRDPESGGVTQIGLVADRKKQPKPSEVPIKRKRRRARRQ